MNSDFTCIRASFVDTSNTGVDISSVEVLIVTSVIGNEYLSFCTLSSWLQEKPCEEP